MLSNLHSTVALSTSIHIYILELHLLGNTNNTTSGTRSSIARLLALLIATFAEIISASVHNNRASEDTLRPDELDVLVIHAALCVALTVRLEVTQVADVAVAVFWGTVFLVVGVDCTTKVSWPMQVCIWGGGAYSVGQRSCSRWYCRRRRGHACHASRWHRCRSHPT